MEINELKERIRNLLAREFLNESEMTELQDDTNLISSGVLDSIKTLMLVDELEKEFGITFEAHEVNHDNIDSIDKMVNFIKQKIG